MMPKITSKKVKFVNPVRLYGMIKNEIDAAYFDVMNKGAFINQQHLWDFEKNLADFVGTKYAVGLNSGYDALMLSVKYKIRSPQDEIIVPAHTFVASCSAIVNAGAKPVLVDVADDFNIDCSKIEAAITPNTRGIMAVHLSGWMADMPRILEIAEEHKLWVVEDACQSLGSSINGKGAGSWGLAGCWSFYPFKILGGHGDGGAITTNDEEFYAWARRLRYNGEDRETGEYHAHGMTCMLDNIQAAWLDVKLRYMPAWIARRKAIAARYKEALGDLPNLQLPHYDRPGFDHIYQNYTLLAIEGEKFSTWMREHGVEVLTQFRKPYYKHSGLGLKDTGFPVTETISREVCSLPMCVEITDEEVEYVVQTIRAFYGK